MPLSLNGSTGIAGIDGSAGTPSVQGADTNTGVFFPAADTVALSTGGTERMRVNSSGNLGVGTSFPAYKLSFGTPANGTKSIALYETGAGNAFYGIGNDSDRMTFYTGNTSGGVERMAINSNGKVLVGTASTFNGAPALQVASPSSGEQIAVRNTEAASGRCWRITADSNNTFYILNENSTGVYIGHGSTSWSGLSDERAKDIIEPITDATSKVASLRAVIGKYKTDEEGKRRSFLIAQDVEAVLPEAVSVANQETGYLGLSYTEVIPLLVAAIKELTEKNAALESRISALEPA